MNLFEQEMAEAEAQWAQAETLEEIWEARARLEAFDGEVDRWDRACRAQGVDPGAIPHEGTEGGGRKK